jgi:CP family cyanate transporter-like MFS transporter
MIGLRARTEAGVGQLSAFAQCVGYLLAVPGPILVGLLYQSTGGWKVPIAFVAALLIPQTISGILAGRNRTIEDENDLSTPRP